MAFKYIGERFSKVNKKGSSIGKQAMPLAMHIFYSNWFKQGYILFIVSFKASKNKQSCLRNKKYLSRCIFCFQFNTALQ